MTTNYFKNLGEKIGFKPADDTLHLAARQKRLAAYADRTATKMIDILVDKGHINGPEIHRILDNAQVNIYNEKSGKFITSLRLRRGQVYRYIKDYKQQPVLTNKQTQILLIEAAENEEMGLNNK
jgi:hypothetical protein